MKAFITNTIVLVAAITALAVAVVGLVATAICFSVLLGSLKVVVHLLAGKNAASENTVDEIDPLVELESLGNFLVILFRVFSLIIKENGARLKSFTSDWAEGGARLVAHFETFGLTQTTQMKKVVAAAIAHSWVTKG